MKSIITKTNIRPATLEDLLREAERRHLLIPTLGEMALSTLSNDDLIDAILEYSGLTIISRED